ncbi:MAG TPA: class I SAM-dependent methyltransferase [Ignavibacteriaceae bacterium]|nr:class I SAM-dependent methyltransferase [Ignavibacteriaceae bacterium]
MKDRNRVCPAELAGSLDSKIRRWLQDPAKILGPYINEGMTVLDIGCGPGFFTLPISRMVGNNGKVIAADLQDAMLQKLREKIRGTELEGRINLHKCEKDKIGFDGKADFILAFYMVHEVPDQESFFKELKSILNEKGSALIVEPKLFHVSKKDFAETLFKAESAGFKPVEGPKLLLSWSAILKN